MDNPLKILVVDDDEEDIFILVEMIVEVLRSPAPQIDSITTLKEAFHRLETENYDLCFVDYRLGSDDGKDLLKFVKKKGIPLPVILLTGLGSQEIAVEAMKSGATDYLSKNKLSSESLSKSIRYALELYKEEELRKQVEDKLLKTNRFLASILNSPTDLSIISTDLEGKILLWNKGAEDLLEYKAQEMIERQNIRVLYPKEGKTRGKIQEAISYVTAKKKAVVIKIEELTKSGKKIWLKLTLSPLYDKTGTVTGFLGVGENITQQKRAEDELRSSEERFRSVVTHIMEGIITINQAGLIRFINPAAEKIFGYPKKEVLGKNINLLMPEPYRSKHDSFIARYLLTGQNRSIGKTREFSGLRRNGEIFPMELSTSEMRVRKELSFIGIVRDISERKEAENALRKSEERARMIIDTAPDAFVALDTDGKIMEWNMRAETMFGWKRLEARGKVWADLVIPEEKREAHARELKSIRETEPGKVLGQSLDMYVLHRDGHEFPVEISLSFLQFMDQSIFNVFIHDVTERKAIQTQLNHAQKMESIGQLAAGIAHEINTPMQFIGDNIRFLQDSFQDLLELQEAHNKLIDVSKREKPLPWKIVEKVETLSKDVDKDFLMEEIPQAIQQSMEGVERVTNIVRAMKEFSHPGSEEKIPIDINTAIDTTLTVTRNEWKYVAEIVRDFDPGLPPVPCYVNDFNQAILNTIINAAHAIEHVVQGKESNKGTITVRTLGKGDWVEIHIEDTGTGIPENIKSRIFDPFFTTKEVGKGTGQGLAIVHGVVVKKHGGTVSLKTQEGKGTTFVFRLPVFSNGSQE